MNRKKIFILILAIGILLRVFLLFHTVNISHDNVMYAKYGQNLIQHGKYEFVNNYNWGVIYPPMYPILIGGFDLIINDLLVSGRLISFICSILTIVIFYLIGKKLYNEEIGLFSALGFSVFPLISFSSTEMTSEPLFLLLFFSAIYIFLLLINKPTKISYYFLFCLIIGMTILTRPEGMILCLLLFIVAIKNIKNYKVLLTIAVSLCFIFLIISPYILFLHKEIGKYKISGAGGANLYLGETTVSKNYNELFYSLNEDKTQLKSLEFGDQVNTISYIIKNFKSMLYRYAINLSKVYIIFNIVLLPFLLFLIVAMLDKNILKNIYQISFLLLAGFITSVYCLYFINPRFLTTPILLLFLFSLNGVHNIDRIKNVFKYYDLNNKIITKVKYNIKIISIVFFILCCVFSFSIETFNYTKIDYTPYKNIAIYIDDHEINNPTIMFRKPIINFFIDSSYVNLPYANTKDIINFAKLYNVDYIIVSEVLNDWPFYKELLTLDEYSPDIELVYEIEEPLIKVYKYNGEYHG